MFRKIFACLAVIAGSVLLAPLSAGANTFNTVRTFCTDGGGCSAGEIYPSAALAEFNGRLYGPAAEGAEFGRGAIFSIDPTTNAYALEVEMNGTTDTGEYGSYPAGPLTLKNGRFYGIASGSGANGNGTIYSFDPTNPSGTLQVEHDFTSAEGSDCAGAVPGSFPAARLVFSGAKMYGIRCTGGANNFGTLFRMKPGMPSSFQLYSFTGGLDGRLPAAGLVAHGGLLYGVTWLGGQFSQQYSWGGGIYSVDPTSSTLVATSVYQFPPSAGGAGTVGTQPSGPLVFKGGYFYGCTDYGGLHSAGTVFKIQPGVWQNIVLHDILPSADGIYNRGELTFVGNTLYGTNGWGAINNDYGTVWKLKLRPNNNNTWSVVHYFANGNDSAVPLSGLTKVGSDLFGTTWGRNPNYGTIFKVTTP